MSTTARHGRHRFYAVPRTSLGLWGAGILVGTFLVLVLMSSIVSVMNHSVVAGRVAAGLGVANAVYVSVTLVGIVLAWVAILVKKDRSVILIVIASLFSALAVFFGVGECVLMQ